MARFRPATRSAKKYFALGAQHTTALMGALPLEQQSRPNLVGRTLLCFELERAPGVFRVAVYGEVSVAEWSKLQFPVAFFGRCSSRISQGNSSICSMFFWYLVKDQVVIRNVRRGIKARSPPPKYCGRRNSRATHGAPKLRTQERTPQ